MFRTELRGEAAHHRSIARWESREDFDAFFGSRVQEAVAAAGVEMQGPPDVKEFPVHEFWQP
jgi:heme-degrading monooxygenase HmoA